jgi:hypothetical protein
MVALEGLAKVWLSLAAQILGSRFAVVGHKFSIYGWYQQAVGPNNPSGVDLAQRQRFKAH